MDAMHSALRVLLVVPALILFACATGRSHPDEGTLIIAEVSRVLSREQVAHGDLAPGEQRDQLAEWVRQHGLSDTDVDAGRAIVVRRGIYWFNTLSGIKHSMAELAHLDPGMKVEVGNVVELRVDSEGRAAVQRVRAASLVDGGCQFVEMPSSLLDEVAGVVGMVGPRGVATLYCAGLESDGWQRPKQFWVKPPAAHPPVVGGNAVPAREAPAQQVDIAPSPTAAQAPVSTLATEHALLLLSRYDIDFAWFVKVPFWVDGEKAAELSSDHRCTMVTVNQGEHVVTAGTKNSGMGAKREVKLVVQAGDIVVVEYVVTTKPWEMYDRKATQWDRCDSRTR